MLQSTMQFQYFYSKKWRASSYFEKEKRYKELYSLDRSLSAYYGTNSVLTSISTKYETAMLGTVD